MATNEATFPIKLDDKLSGPAQEAAAAMASLRSRIEGSMRAIQDASSAMRKLRGSTDEIKKAKGSLADKVGAERDQIVALQRQMKKHQDVLAKEKRAQEERLKNEEKIRRANDDAKKYQDALNGAIESGGGPLGEMSGLLGKIGGLAGGAAGPMGLLVAAAAALVAGVVDFAAALARGAASLARWIITTADAARTAGLLREALTGSAQQGDALGSQVDALARKISTPKGEIAELSQSLYKAGLGGQTFVDSLQAIGRTSDAVGKDVGGKLQGILERGILPNGAEGRFSVTLAELRELRRSGVDLAGALAKQTGQGVASAQAALLSGRVPIAQGAALLRKATEDGFGKINAKKLLSLPVLEAKFWENLANLAKRVDVEPLLRGLESIAHLFDVTTPTGAALRQIVEDIGGGLSKLGGGIAPTLRDSIRLAILSASELELMVLEADGAVRQAFKDHPFLKTLTADLLEAINPLNAMRIAWAELDGSITIAEKSFTVIKSTIASISASVKSIGDAFKAVDWVEIGASIPAGVAAGLESGASKLKNAAKGLADAVKDAFKLTLQIGSPSKVFEEYGEDTTAGYARGVRKSQERAGDAVDGMIAFPASRPSGGASSKSEVTYSITINVTSEEAARHLTTPSFREQFTTMLEELNAGAGIPRQS